MAGEDDKKLYKIGEVCKQADVQPYVLRYWETEFPSLAPNKSGGGQRMYSKHEIDIILRIKQLLYSEGFTIAGAKKKLETELAAPVPEPVEEAPGATATRKRSKPAADPRAKAILKARRELTALLELLRD
jgi:DNA-binding transcriptional MerR regulator